MIDEINSRGNGDWTLNINKTTIFCKIDGQYYWKIIKDSDEREEEEKIKEVFSVDLQVTDEEVNQFLEDVCSTIEAMPFRVHIYMINKKGTSQGIRLNTSCIDRQLANAEVGILETRYSCRSMGSRYDHDGEGPVEYIHSKWYIVDGADYSKVRNIKPRQISKEAEEYGWEHQLECKISRPYRVDVDI